MEKGSLPRKYFIYINTSVISSSCLAKERCLPVTGDFKLLNLLAQNMWSDNNEWNGYTSNVGYYFLSALLIRVRTLIKLSCKKMKINWHWRRWVLQSVINTELFILCVSNTATSFIMSPCNMVDLIRFSDDIIRYLTDGKHLELNL